MLGIEELVPGAEGWLEQLLTNAVPKKVGRVTLSYLLTSKGGVRSEFTVYKMAPQRYYLVSAGAYERHDHDYLKKAMPRDGSVNFERLTTAMGVLVLAGPRSRDVLVEATRALDTAPESRLAKAMLALPPFPERHDADRMRVRDADDAAEHPGLADPLEAGQLAIAVEPVAAGEHRFAPGCGAAR